MYIPSCSGVRSHITTLPSNIRRGIPQVITDALQYRSGGTLVCAHPVHGDGAVIVIPMSTSDVFSHLEACYGKGVFSRGSVCELLRTLLFGRVIKIFDSSVVICTLCDQLLSGTQTHKHREQTLFHSHIHIPTHIRRHVSDRLKLWVDMRVTVMPHGCAEVPDRLRSSASQAARACAEVPQ